MTSFNATLTDNAARIEAALDQLLTPVRLTGPGAPSARLIAAMRHGALGGGKRLRPLLVGEVASLLGVTRATSLSAAIAIELVHCYSLVHDDLPAMDDDDLRRGRPTVHKAFDAATAILAGDALLTLAFRVLAEDEAVAAATRLKLIAELAAGAGTGGMVGGQMRDIEGEGTRLSAEAIAAMQAMKTGALIRAAVRTGAIIGGADSEALAALTGYGEAAGRAFQLADDLLDVTASANALGKATSKDAAMGKQTLVVRIGVEAAQHQLGELVHDALTALTPFGPEANGLREAARYFATREN